MAILDETEQFESITEARRALQYFTNRHGLIRRFAESLHETPRNQILFLHGDGGNGKTLLLRYLKQNCCKRLSADGWDYVRSLEGDAFVENIVQAVDYSDVLSSMIDFGAEPCGEYRPKEAFSALLKMRRDLSGGAITFPRFDFACILYLQKTGRLSPDKLKELFPKSEVDLILTLADVITNTKLGGITKAILGLFNRGSLKESLTLHQYGKKIDDALVEKLQPLEAETDLYRELITLFAKDLNEAVTEAAAQRVVLFFDTHEAFWNVTERKFASEQYYLQDEWLRRLLVSLDFQKGIVAVVAGREKPQWADAAKAHIPTAYTETHLVGSLSTVDAGSYLDKVEIKEPALKQSLLQFAEERPNEVHPYYLGLCVDVVLAAQKQGREIKADEFNNVPEVPRKGQDLMSRLGKYVEDGTMDAIKALCACRSFDRNLYLKLMETLTLPATRDGFEYLTEFSFVWNAGEQNKGWYRIHDLMRRLVSDQQEEITREAHQMLVAYYDSRAQEGELAAIAERAYHQNRLNSSEGVKEWVEQMQEALSRSRYDLCRTLLAIRNELLIANDFERGRVSQTEGEFYQALSMYENARVEYEESIAAYDEALRRAPDDVGVHNNKGTVLRKLGDLQAGLAQHPAALRNYEESITACDEALRRAPDDVIAHNNKGTVLRRLGDLQAGLAQHPAALIRYEESIAAYDEALRRAPDDVIVHNNKGIVLQRLGDLQAELAQHPAALRNYEESIAAFDEAMRRAPDDVIAHNNKGIVLRRLGDLQAGLAQHPAALRNYEESIAAFDEALRRAPDFVKAHNNKGKVLTRLGALQAELAQHPAALRNYEESIAAFDEALRRAPDFVLAHNNKGKVLTRLGDLQAGLAQHSAALRNYEESIAAFDEALRRTPDYVNAHKNKGKVLTRLGALQAGLSQHSAALTRYEESIAAYDEALRRAPDYVLAHNNKGTVLTSLGELQAGLAQHQESLLSIQAAVSCFSRSLEIAPGQELVRKQRDELKKFLAENG